MTPRNLVCVTFGRILSWSFRSYNAFSKSVIVYNVTPDWYVSSGVMNLLSNNAAVFVECVVSSYVVSSGVMNLLSNNAAVFV